MRRNITIIALLGLMVLMVPSIAHAITYGSPDGEGHPNVGVLIVEIEGEKFGLCSGTLIDQDVYLTAGHCVAWLPSIGVEEGEEAVWVSFASEFDVGNSKLHSGVYYLHPGYGGSTADFNDIAVIVLDEEVGGLTPASLPSEGLLDDLGPKGLRDQLFTAVGYGVTEPDIGDGPPQFSGFGIRRYSVSSFNALNDNWLRLSQTNATGDSGTCFGDSGGPHFLGAATGETDIIVSLTSTGDAMCLATNDTYRIDTASALGFIEPFLEVEE